MLLLGLQLYVVLLFMTCGVAMAQQPGRVWYFGAGAGLDFTNGTPVAMTNNASYCLDQSTACTDANGAVKFYTNGVDVFNANHQIMANGSDIGVSYDGGQCALIVPQPQSTRCYVFTVGNWDNANGFRYSVVDLALQGGLGEVVEKNMLLFAPSTERIAMTYDAANNRYWVVTHAWNSADFMAYEVSSSGLNQVPVVSSVGSIHSGGTPSGYNAVGQMTISPNGARLACGIYSSGQFELFDFNLATGSVSNARGLSGHPKAWGSAFSPNSNVLYLTHWFGADILQVDATLSNPSSSQIVVGTVDVPLQYQVGFLELGPDGKIYAAKWQQNNLAEIAQPDLLGLACSFEDVGVSLGVKNSLAGLCRSVQLPNCLAAVSQNQDVCQGQEVTVSYSGSDFIGWAMEAEPNVIIDTDPNHTFICSEAINFIAIGSCDTFYTQVQVVPEPRVVPDSNLCLGYVVLGLDHWSPLWYNHPIWNGTTQSEFDTIFPGESINWTVTGQCGTFSGSYALDEVGSCLAEIPNVFTPNDDHINDLFLSTSDNCSGCSFQMTIYDRWGLKAYESDQPWNGIRNNGMKAVDGVYYYVIAMYDKTFTGVVHVLAEP